ncbi:MAG TPA: hypothetical protein VK604_16795 [Bryobacteraceae bacterium]|nr:hypothetical protein [Bryobacteraceae bacterium]
MTVTLDLPLNVTQAYLAAAQARGLRLEEVMRDTLVAAQPADEATPLSADEWIQKLEAWGARNAHKDLPILSDEALRRESMYEDRGL